MVKKRLASPDQQHKKGDLLDHFLQDMKSYKFVTQDFIVQQLFGLTFVSFDSVSKAATYLIKFLGENPLVLEELTVHTYASGPD